VNNHAVWLAGEGRQAEAVPVSEEAVAMRRELAEQNRDAYLPDLAESLNNHAIRLAEVGRQAEAVPVSEEAVAMRRELAEQNRDVYLYSYVQSQAALGHVLMEDARPREAIAPLVDALKFSRQLPHQAQGIVGTIQRFLRRAYAGDPAGAAQEFRTLTGQDLPSWMT
jgi:hypothetical protein